MSRTPLPYAVGDISALARSLKAGLDGRDTLPGHVELLNMLARAGGWRNFQHFRAQSEARTLLEAPPAPPPEPVDYQRVRRIARHFDDAGRLMRWPGKFGEQQTCLWVIWSRLPARQTLAEKAVNQAITAQHGFGDYALIRRELIDGGWLTRTADGSEYRRVERQPPADAMALIRHLAGR
jgi:hypothetical protein